MKRQIIVEGDLAYVPLTRGFVAVIDAADVHLVERYTWHAKVGRSTVYGRRNEAVAGGGNTTILLHRVILGIYDAEIHADHIDGDGLNNRRANLRKCSRAENQRNRGAQQNSTSGFKGVTWSRQKGKWRASIQVAGSTKNLGYFETSAAAHEAYSAAAVTLHGEFARAA